MGYIIDEIIPNLKHKNSASFLSEKTLRDSIWYSCTNESYAQRTPEYDNTWLYKGSFSDIYVKLALKHFFCLDRIEVFRNADACNTAIQSLSVGDCFENILYMYVPNIQSIFEVYINSLRNGFAHGSFNHIGEKYYVLNQHRAKADSPIKFLLATNSDIDAEIKNLFDFFRNLLEKPLEGKYQCLSWGTDIEKLDDRLFSNKLESFIIFDDTFKFVSSKHKDEIQEYLMNLGALENTIVVVEENLGNIADKNLMYNQVRVISASKVEELFDLPQDCRVFVGC